MEASKSGNHTSDPSKPYTTDVSLAGPSGNPPAPQPASADLNKAPQLSEPSQSELAKDIDLNPTASDIKDDPPSEPVKPPAITTDPAKATSEESKGLTTEPSSAPKAAAAPSTGMSATSGPLSDHMDEGYIDDDDVDVGPKGEKLEDVGKTAESVGGAKEAESEQLQEGGKA